MVGNWVVFCPPSPSPPLCVYRQYATAALTFSEGYRAPTLQEAVMLGDTGKFFHIPNHDLGPETSDTVELLARVRVSRVRLGITGYVSFLDDLIKREEAQWEGQSEMGGKGVWKNVNGGEGLIWGTEVDLVADLGRGVSLGGNLTYTRGEEHVPGAENVPLTRIPPLFGTVRVGYEAPQWSGWTLFGEAFVRGAAKQDRLSPEDEEDVRIPEGGTPGWWTLNVRTGATMDRWLRLLFSAENLLDEEYKYHASGVYAPGLNLVGTLEAVF